MKLYVINGPNLNKLGTRQPELYGNKTLKEIEVELGQLGTELGIEVRFCQSNLEGEIVSLIQIAGDESDGIVLNAAAYTHTSVAIRDAVLCCAVPVVEVHLTNPNGRELFRRDSLLSDVCDGLIAGFGWRSYCLA
ncbi:MAG: type II 3-dehydroquinate dehydratase, partial [Pseudomonadota bacterium]